MNPNLKSRLKKIFSGIGKVLKWMGIFIAFFLYMLMGMVVYWYVRPNTSYIDPTLLMQNWVVVDLNIDDFKHSSNTDMIFWNGSFYLIHQNSPYHLGNERSKLMIWRSSDARVWQLEKIIYMGKDVRDPKFAAIGSRLYIYALINEGSIAAPYSTVYTYSEDGNSWTNLKFIEPYGWLFWRAKTYDNKTWYVPAYWFEHGASVLLNSTDGENWYFVSFIYFGERNDETALEFFPDGRMIVTGRLEGNSEFLFGDNAGSTLIAVSDFPYQKWRYIKSDLTRLDGPCLFKYNGKIFAVGRFEPQNDPFINQRGSFFTRKRTSIFQVTELGLMYITDLPSCGDTSYAGIVIQNDQAYISYYTSPLENDIPWILGVISKSQIRISQLDLNRLSSLADIKFTAGQINNYDMIQIPLLDYIAFSFVLISEISIIFILKNYKRLSKKRKKALYF